MKVKTYILYLNDEPYCYGLIDSDGHILHCPQFKTWLAAKRWAENMGFEFNEKRPKGR